LPRLFKNHRAAEQWTFKQRLGLVNSILTFTFGVKITPLERNSPTYKLFHLFHFRNPSVPAADSGSAAWPPLD